MRRALAVGVIMTTALLGACGDDDSTSSSGTSTTGGSAEPADAIEVVAKDIEFDSDSYRAPAGAIDVVYRNEGSIIHTFVIEDVDGFKLEVGSKGDTDEGTVELEAGTYTVYCDVPGHRAAGMEATLEVG